MLSDPIYTIEEVAEHLKVPLDAVHAEIASGNLAALKVVSFWRVRESALKAYLGTTTAMIPHKVLMESLQGQLVAAADFLHTWPDKKRETFIKVQEGVIPYAGREYHVKVGFTVRHSAGKDRRRSLVIVDRYPSVEFVASSASETEKRMASIIKDRRGKQLPAGATVPPEYADLTVGSYREVVNGRGASNGLAVLCDADDVRTMVQHGLIRYRYRQERGQTE
jgi:excisionase family DNA binding protein